MTASVSKVEMMHRLDQKLIDMDEKLKTSGPNEELRQESWSKGGRRGVFSNRCKRWGPFLAVKDAKQSWVGFWSSNS